MVAADLTAEAPERAPFRFIRDGKIVETETFLWLLVESYGYKPRDRRYSWRQPDPAPLYRGDQSKALLADSVAAMSAQIQFRAICKRAP